MYYFTMSSSSFKEDRIKGTRRTRAEHTFIKRKQGEQLNVQHKGAKGRTLCTEKEMNKLATLKLIFIRS